jgi:HD superfamily phosphohydrolase
VRIAELMLSKAMESVPDMHPFDFFKLTDAELIETLKDNKGFQKEIITRLKYRRLFKQVYVLGTDSRTEETMNLLKKLEDNDFRRNLETQFEQTLSIPQGHIIIDTPLVDLLQAEPRIQEIDMPVIEDDDVKMLTNYTPVAAAIGMRKIPDWDLMIISDETYRDTISAHADHILFSQT